MPIGAVYAEQFIGSDGNVLAGGLLYTYLAGTSTYQPVYANNDLTGAIGQPVVLDGNGRCQFYLADVAYKFVITDADGNPYDEMDNFKLPAPSAGDSQLPDWLPVLTW
jgi:hypothetical protein